MTAYYNENDPYAAQWLRNLVAAGRIAAGEVDERSIEDVRADELAGFTQCHFFAGIGVWSYAMRQAGWPDDQPAWTGSCPCQPWSSIGKQAGINDPRHLWPNWFGLISERAPDVVFGEQVASKDGYAWLDLVQDDMEGMGYAFGPIVSPAAGYGAPHQRHRIYFVGDSLGEGLERFSGDGNGEKGRALKDRSATAASSAGLLANDMRAGRSEGRPRPGRGPATGRSSLGRMEHTHQPQHHREEPRGRQQSLRDQRTQGPVNGYWNDADWIPCRDGKWRSIEPGTFPLAHGVANRMDKIRAFGNAIVATQAIEFVRAYMDTVQTVQEHE